MTLPATRVLEDDAVLVIDSFVDALLAAFNPNDVIQPPLGGGSTTVHFIAGHVVPLELWDAFASGTDCAEPFLWVRLTRRFRSRSFPAVSGEPESCTLPRVIELEMGVGRCAALSATVDWTEIAAEAQVSLDDSWRMELALCRAVSEMAQQDRLVATEPILPFGPEGGVIAWSTTAFVKLN